VGYFGSLVLYHVESGCVLDYFRAPSAETDVLERYTDLAFSPDGSLLAASMEATHHVQLWETVGGRLLADFSAGDGAARLAFRPDGRALAVTGEEQTRLYELAGMREQTVAALQPFALRAFAFAPDGLGLACLSESERPDQGDLTIWPLPRDETALPSVAPLRRWPVVLPSVNDRAAVAFDPTGEWLACAQMEQVALVRTGKPADLRAVAVARANALSFAGAGRLWTGAQADVRAWTVPEGKETAHWGNSLTAVLSSMDTVNCVSAGRRHVLVGCRDGSAHLLRPEDGSAVDAWSISSAEILAAALHPGEELAAFGSDKGELQLVRLPGGEVAASLRPHEDAIEAAAFAGDLLATGSRDGTVRLWLWDGADLEELLTLPCTGPVVGLAFSPDGDSLAVLSRRERAARVWHLDRLRRSLAEMNLDW
jgi:WD40 repeat protein